MSANAYPAASLHPISARKMKRMHLFEFEDFNWFPRWLRVCMTRMIVVVHKMLGSGEELAKLQVKALPHAPQPIIIDLCSGSGGPVIEAFDIIKKQYTISHISLVLTDLYPDVSLAKKLNSQHNQGITYLLTPVNAAQVNADLIGLRTMVSSFHHMKPALAHQILKDARDKKQPICIFEISDNSFPAFIWWISIFTSFIMALLITPFVRPLSWQQIVFTYLIPVLPFCFAWDGAVSNARTYTLEDLDILLEDLRSEDYHWEKGTIGGKMKKLYLLGLPKSY